MCVCVFVLVCVSLCLYLCFVIHRFLHYVLGIYSHLASERLVVLLEDAKSPAASVTANRISVETIRQTMRDNQWLHLPRLSSQTILDELCPVASSSSSSNGDDRSNNVAKTFCVVLLTKRDDDRSRRSAETFRKFARDFKQNHSHDGSPKINFAYMFKTTQGAFFEALERRKQPPGSTASDTTTTSTKTEKLEEVDVDKDSGVDVDPIALFWRDSAEGLRFSWAPRGWASLKPEVEVSSDVGGGEDGGGAFDAAAAAAVKRARKKLVRQAQSSLSAFIATILSTPSHELHQHLIAGLGEWGVFSFLCFVLF